MVTNNDTSRLDEVTDFDSISQADCNWTTEGQKAVERNAMLDIVTDEFTQSPLGGRG